MSAEKIAEVIAAHWSFTTDSSKKPFVDRCDGCKEAVYSWGSPSSEQQKARPAHQAEMVAAALEPANREREETAFNVGYAKAKNDGDFYDVTTSLYGTKEES